MLEMRKKSISIIVIACLLLFITSGLTAFANVDKVVEPPQELPGVCSVYGINHGKDSQEWSKFAFYEGGPTYPFSEYYCPCGAHIAIADVNMQSYYFYSSRAVQKYDPTGTLVLFEYRVPREIFNGNPPGWN